MIISDGSNKKLAYWKSGTQDSERTQDPKENVGP